MSVLGRKRRQGEQVSPPGTQTIVERRLDIHVEREWVTVPQGTAPAVQACSVCGDERTLSLAEAGELLSGGLDQLRTAIESGELHLWRRSPSEIAVCRLSVERKMQGKHLLEP